MIGSNNHELIGQVLSAFTRENESLFDQLQQIGYYMRGYYTRDDVWSLTFAEREKSVEFINKRFDDAKDFIKAQIPIFL